MGFGLGAAVLIDATIVRSILVPSVMKLLGEKLGISLMARMDTKHIY